ncbi:hypothetical protein LEP48_05755 [Isoptericola sp. NEAU-Y5]|uniref:Uncharacterized protein n=1 Tax=Isoptericola luteus TaxID=2879484 RepID=A0ABS7ZCT4_9MICO|nr:hypothetical protein [Isoptericola sp. NEAU-Y5]
MRTSGSTRPSLLRRLSSRAGPGGRRGAVRRPADDVGDLGLDAVVEDFGFDLGVEEPDARDPPRDPEGRDAGRRDEGAAGRREDTP